MSKIFYVDFDDFHENNTQWHMLSVLKDNLPNFKVTLFTVPALCSTTFIRKMRAEKWIQMIPHGAYHTTSRECQYWNYETSVEWLISLENSDWIHGWKSPGWQTSDGMFKALLERDWWVADQPYNDWRRPEKLRTYFLDDYTKIHGHLGHMGSHNANAIEYILDDLLALKGEFGFISDLCRNQ